MTSAQAAALCLPKIYLYVYPTLRKIRALTLL